MVVLFCIPLASRCCFRLVHYRCDLRWERSENICFLFLLLVLVTLVGASVFRETTSATFIGVDNTISGFLGLAFDFLEIGDMGDGSFVISFSGFGREFGTRGILYSRSVVHAKECIGNRRHKRRLSLFWILLVGVLVWCNCRRIH